jgi:hypothetical protein
MSGSGEFTVGDEVRDHRMDMTAAGQGRMEAIKVGDIYWMGASVRAARSQGRWIASDSTSDHPNAMLFSSSLTTGGPLGLDGHLLKSPSRRTLEHTIGGAALPPGPPARHGEGGHRARAGTDARTTSW